jgi:hypothetical protein
MQVKKALLFSLLLLPCLVQAQWVQNPFLHELKLDSAHRFQNIGSYSYRLASTALTNRLYRDYLYTPFIEDEVKNTVLPKLKDNNYFGGYSDLNLTFIYPESRIHGSAYIRLKSRTQLGCNFRPDVYRVLFYGNKAYAGQTAVGDGSNYLNMNYKEFSAGAIFDSKKKNKAGRSTLYGGGIGLAFGGKILELRGENASIFTSSTGDSLFIRAKATAAYSDRSVRNPTITNGLGITANLFLQLPVGATGTLSAAADNIGYISYAKNDNVKFSADESFSYTGYKADSASISSLSNAGFILDSLKGRVDSMQSHQGFKRMLPAQLQLCYRYAPASGKWAIEAGGEYVLFAYSRPEIYAAASWSIAKPVSLSGGAHLGGYGTYGILANVKISVAKHVQAFIGTEDVEAIFSRDKTTSQGAFAQVRISF